MEIHFIAIFEKLILVMWDNLDNKNPQSNYEGRPQCLEDFIIICHYLTSHAELVFFEIPIKHIPIMSGSDSELNKYNTTMMTVTF